MNVKINGVYKTHMPEYDVWSEMKRRCRNPNGRGYRFYGARGIKVCDRWSTFENFYSDMGPRPTAHHSIDRKDSQGDYEPKNCRWVATQKEQCRNTRRNRYVTLGNKTLCIAAWCECLGLRQTVVQTRIFRGMDPVMALTTPPRLWPAFKR